MPSPPLANVRVFAPESWGEVAYFSKFYAATYEFKVETKRALSGVSSHFDKAMLLLNVARKIAPNLALDREQLNTMGATPAHNSREFSAVIEEVFTELYSSIDCASKVIAATHKHCRGMPAGSTRRLFSRIAEGKIGSDFPEQIKRSMVAAEWYWDLLFLRDELTHLSVGSCSLSADSDAVTYMHQGISKGGQPLVIEDILAHAADLCEKINQFLGEVFHYLNSELKPSEIDVPCAVAYGRIYMRRLSSQRPVTFQSGNCNSRQWFDADEAYRCPLANGCDAYKRPVVTEVIKT